MADRSSTEFKGISLNFDFVILFAFALLFVLPSGFIFGLPLKHILVALIILFCFAFKQLVLVKSSLVALCCFVILSPALFFGVNLWGGLAFRELQMILLPVFLAALLYYYCYKWEQGRSKVGISVYFWVLWIAFFLKLSMVSYVFLGFGGGEDLLKLFNLVFGSTFVSMEIAPGVPRIFLASDAAIAFMPYFYALGLKRGILPGSVRSALFFLAISFFVIFISYSRFLWLIYLLGCSYLFCVLRLSLFSRLFVFFFAFLAVAVLSFSYSDLFEARFSERHNVESDAIRVEQFNVLSSMWEKRPVLGYGLGAYDEDYIRSESEPYSYEMQLFSLLPKLGGVVFGLICLLIFSGMAFMFLNGQYFFVLLSLVILIAGLTNPYLFTSNFSIVYFMLFASVSSQASRETFVSHGK